MEREKRTPAEAIVEPLHARHLRLLEGPGSPFQGNKVPVILISAHRDLDKQEEHH